MNFALIMFILLLVTGGMWLLDFLLFRRMRAANAKEPWWIEYPKSFFPVILVVFLLRSFLVEPFKIPSGSMIPTLLVGDFILVNKYAYGVRLPILNQKIADVNLPKRGEVMVFRYPKDQSLDYIKRVIGIPGDKVTYRDKRLYINGMPVKMQPDGEYAYIERDLNFMTLQRYREHLGAHTYSVIVRPDAIMAHIPGPQEFPYRENCTYYDEGFTCVVPPQNYFVMGDNRDSSSDSRYWGFVPEKNIVGKAFLIWFNFDDFKRIGRSIK